ncbi:MAG: hypothetical protein M1822_007964 [Bathelium mastoideum]|nr:MAG: hypothetical protein M1822_007964 [Bathelium mastoideum]
MWFHSKSHLRQPKPNQQGLPNLQSLQPRVYRPDLKTWDVSQGASQQCLERGCALRIVSWNIGSGFWATERTTAAMRYLKNNLGNETKSTVIMLQDFIHKSVQAILNDRWVQQNFTVTNVDDAQGMFVDEADKVLTFKMIRPAKHPLTMMLVSKDISIEKCFRVPLITEMGRHALVIDIPIKNEDLSQPAKQCLRLCTTQLESHYDEKGYRPSQLALISSILKEKSTSPYKIAAGIVGGNMNALDKTEHEFHKREDVGLRDVWLSHSLPPVPKLKPIEKKYGRAKGNTFGYQSIKRQEGMRSDKFFYTGRLEVVPLEEFDDSTRGLSRLGLGLKTEVDALKTAGYFKQGKIATKFRDVYLPLDIHTSRDHYTSPDRPWPYERPPKLLRVKHECWVSEHFGIAVGIKVK